MGRQLRKVPANWKHPKDSNGIYIPLMEGDYSEVLAKWKEEKKQWEQGFRRDYNSNEWILKEEKYNDMPFIEWSGKKPLKESYLPEWDESEKTHIQLYETTSEGTPVSPVFEADELEKLCEYASENCTTFADFKASKEAWMQMLSDDFVCHKEGNIIFF